MRAWLAAVNAPRGMTVKLRVRCLAPSPLKDAKFDPRIRLKNDPFGSDRSFASLRPLREAFRSELLDGAVTLRKTGSCRRRQPHVTTHP